MITKITHRPLSDMESDGVYFPETVKEKIAEYREKELCHYSGLPSVWSYSENRHVEPQENYGIRV